MLGTARTHFYAGANGLPANSLNLVNAWLATVTGDTLPEGGLSFTADRDIVWALLKQAGSGIQLILTGFAGVNCIELVAMLSNGTELRSRPSELAGVPGQSARAWGFGLDAPLVSVSRLWLGLRSTVPVSLASVRQLGLGGWVEPVLSAEFFLSNGEPAVMGWLPEGACLHARRTTLAPHYCTLKLNGWEVTVDSSCVPSSASAYPTVPVVLVRVLCDRLCEKPGY